MWPLPNRTFQPEAPVLRAEAAQIADRILGLAGRRPKEWARIHFRDVQPENRFYEAICRVMTAGIFPLETEDELFRPSQPLSGLEALELVDRLNAYLAAVK